FFFFQAEDGIRDGHVTGVQTCALPIYRFDNPLEIVWIDPLDLTCRRLARDVDFVRVGGIFADGGTVRIADQHHVTDGSRILRVEIGRASCRERVEQWGGAVSVKKKNDG